MARCRPPSPGVMGTFVTSPPFGSSRWGPAERGCRVTAGPLQPPSGHAPPGKSICPGAAYNVDGNETLDFNLRSKSCKAGFGKGKSELLSI